VGAEQHRAEGPKRAAVRVGVITVSDTRTPENDEGGKLARELCEGAGYVVAAGAIVPDDPERIAAKVRALVGEGGVDAVLLTGGTGLSPRDSTPEAVAPLLDKTLPGYGELFRALSFAEIGAAAMLSRAAAGSIGAVAVFTLPGSPAGVRLALEKLIIPELGHVVGQLRREERHHHHGHHDHR
jgi:molybdenum cofactor biosynthesis protein B